MTNITEAEIRVDTVFSIETGAGNAHWFTLADYDSLHEFLIDCAGWFEEDDPEYVYLEWWGIPNGLITRNWLCPTIFYIRDALQALDDDSIGPFMNWCANNGHDLENDDPYMLVVRYQDQVHPCYESEPYQETEGGGCYDNFNADPLLETEGDGCGDNLDLDMEPLHLLLGQGFGTVEIFDDDYG